MIDRRQFNLTVGKFLLTGTVAVALSLNGCNIMSDIVAWEPSGLAAFNGIVTALGEFGIILNPADLLIVAAVRTLMNNLYADAKTYLALVPPPATIIAKIQEVLSLISGNIQQFLTGIEVVGSTIIGLIVSIGQVILSTIAGFIGGIPPAAPTPAAVNRVSVMAGNMMVGQGQNRAQLAFVAQKRNVKQFAHDCDAIFAAYGRGELEF
jgi:hypothetical protein